MIASFYHCWLYAPPVLALTEGQYAVTIIDRKFLFPPNRIHYHRLRVQDSWPIAINLHDTSSTYMIALPPLWTVPSEMSTRLYPLLILPDFNHLPVLFFLFSYMETLIQLLFTSASPTTDISSLIMILFRVAYLFWLGLSDGFHITTMFWNMILILPFL